MRRYHVDGRISYRIVFLADLTGKRSTLYGVSNYPGIFGLKTTLATWTPQNG
jgi:hypothetical protein